MKLTITGKVETIIGVMQKLDICDAKFNINDGFTVNLDEVPQVAQEDPVKRGVKHRHKRVVTEAPAAASEPEDPALKYEVTCKLCASTFKARHPRMSYCPTCLSMYGSKEECDKKRQAVDDRLQKGL